MNALGERRKVKNDILTETNHYLLIIPLITDYSLQIIDHTSQRI